MTVDELINRLNGRRRKINTILLNIKDCVLPEAVRNKEDLMLERKLIIEVLNDLDDIKTMEKLDD